MTYNMFGGTLNLALSIYLAELIVYSTVKCCLSATTAVCHLKKPHRHLLRTIETITENVSFVSWAEAPSV